MSTPADCQLDRYARHTLSYKLAPPGLLHDLTCCVRSRLRLCPSTTARTVGVAAICLTSTLVPSAERAAVQVQQTGVRALMAFCATLSPSGVLGLLHTIPL